MDARHVATHRRMRAGVVLFGMVLATHTSGGAVYGASRFTLFESGHVRPLALSPDGARLFAVNTPDNRVEIFQMTVGGFDHAASVPVGLEPVAVAARSSTEVWVVNHLSDSVSVVDVSDPSAPRVVRTLLVGDEPRDIVFAGPSHARAFITTAHRGQNVPGGDSVAYAQLTTAGVGRADVWVFDADDLGSPPGGTPLTIVTLFADTPRALAVSPDGTTVYAAAFHSGNRTTTLAEPIVPDGGAAANPTPVPSPSAPAPTPPCIQGAAPGCGLPEPNTNFEGIPQPEVGLIVQFDGTHWVDELERIWDEQVRFSLPDRDVFVIDAIADPPVQVAGPAGFRTGVGTVLFNMAVNPVSGRVYVANTDARNSVRFEGPGLFAAGFGGTTVRGHLAESRITVLDGVAVLPRHLNKHIDYESCCAPAPNSESERSLAFPLGMAVSSDGARLYVAAFGSDKIGVLDTGELEADTFVPSAADHIAVSGGGPSGLVLDEPRMRLYVLTRFDNALSIVSTATGSEIAHLPLFNPEPASVVTGRRFLYDARLTSSHGDSACASCHIFGDFDSLAWDLGDPDGTESRIPGPFVPPLAGGNFHPMKGPMTTQSLRGMANHGAMHWRGDRNGGDFPFPTQPDGTSFDEDAGFRAFNVAFPGLLGRSEELAPDEMQAFTDFILQVTYPPNPIRALDNSLTPDQAAGRVFFFGLPDAEGDPQPSDVLNTCNSCHKLDRTANAEFGVPVPGFFGTDGRFSFEDEPQFFKVPHLRNLYQKVGMFGMPAVKGFNPGDNGFTGEQIRGFGFLHDGSVDTLFRFHNAVVFNAPQASIFFGHEEPGLFDNPGGFPVGPTGDQLRRQVEQFMLAFDSNLAPIVGQQTTLDASNGAMVGARIDLLLARADAGECDLVAKSVGRGEEGYLYVGNGTFVGNRVGDPPLSDAELRAMVGAGGAELTYTCAPTGSGIRMALDRDDDGFADGDEYDSGSNPADPESVPDTAALCTSVAPTTFRRATLKDATGMLSIRVDLALATYVQESVSVVALDSGGTIVSRNVPGTAIVPRGSGFKYTAPRGAVGVTRVALRPKNGMLTVKLKTRRAWTPPRADEDEATTEVILNVGGRCFRGNALRVR